MGHPVVINHGINYQYFSVACHLVPEQEVSCALLVEIMVNLLQFLPEAVLQIFLGILILDNNRILNI